MVLHEGAVDTRPLRYGDEVVLTELATHALLRSSAGLGTYLYGDELAEDVPGRSAISTPGIHECAFRLCVHQEHCAQDELAKALAANRLRPDTWREQLGPAHPLYPGISGLAHGADAEAQANERRGSAARGRVITYGERVQLLHTWSGRLVTVIREHSEQNPQGMLIQLVERVDEGAWFTVLSPGKVLRHGDRVRNNAELVLESARYPGRYVAFNTGNASLDAGEDIEASLLPHTYISKRFECYLGFHRQVFSARIFRQQDEGQVVAREDASAGVHSSAKGLCDVEAASPQRRILGTDIVQVYHPEGDAMLVVEVPTRATADLSDFHKPPDRGVAFFMPLHGRQQDPGAKSLFLVQHVEVRHGGEGVGPRDVFLLQHVVTGLYLCWEGSGTQLSATSDYSGRVRALGGQMAPPPELGGGHQEQGYDPDASPPSPRSPHLRQSPALQGAHSPGAHSYVPYSGASNPCEMSLVHVNPTSGAVLPESEGQPFSFSAPVFLSHRDGGELTERLFLRKRAAVTKVGVKELCGAVSTHHPSVAECLLEIRPSDMSLARSVLDITVAVGVINGLVANIARSDNLRLPKDRNGDVDMEVRDDYVLEHPTTSLVLNSVVLLDHLVSNLLTWCESVDPLAEDLDGEDEGDIGQEELGRSDFRGGVGGARGSGSAGTAVGAGWGDERKNAGKGSRMQHLLRQHGGVEIVCKLVQTVFSDKCIPLDMVHECVLGDGLLELARKSYRFMTLAMRGNNANRRICVQFVRTFQRHLTVDFLAVECLFELFRGPKEVLAMLREDFFTSGVRMLRQRRSSAMLMLFSACCVAGDGQAVRENQARVLKFFFEQAPDLLLKVRHSLPTLESDPFTANIHFSDRIPGGASGEVSALDLRDMNDDVLHDYRAATDPLVALFQYYLASLELLCAVVHDRYWPASQHMMEHSFELACGYNDLLFLVKHEMCPWILRCHACNAMTALYVDRAPFLQVETVNSIRTWSKLHESVADEKLRKDEPYNFLPDNLRPPSGFRELKEHCLTQLDKCSNIDADATGQTLFSQRIADLCLRMARLGAYHQYDDHFRLSTPMYDDIKPLCSLLVGILDGRTDQISLPQEELPDRADVSGAPVDQDALDRVRLAQHPSTQVLRDLKVTICDLLAFFWAIRVDDRISKFFEKYEQLIDDDVGPALFASVTRGTEKKKAANEFTAVVPGDGSPGARGKKGKVQPEEEEDELSLPLSYANNVEKWGPSQRPLWSQQVVTELVQTLFRNDTYGREVIEVRALKEPEGSLSVVTRVLLDLSLYKDPRLSRRAFELLMCQLGQRHHFVRHIAAVHLIVRPRSARAFFKTRADVHEFRLALPWVHRDDVSRRADAMHSCERLLTKWVQNLRGHGARQGRDAKEEADTDEGEYRRMLFQMGAHRHVMELLLLPMRRVFAKKEGELDTAVDRERQELFSKCHEFVAALCAGHRTAQEFFFRHREVLQSHLGIVGLPVAETLAALVQDHEGLVREAGEEYVRTLFGALRHYNTKRGAWIEAVRAMVLVGGVPVKHHQNVALEYLALHSQEFCSLMLKASEWNMRIDLVFEGELRAPHLTTSRLDYHLACINLLADSAMGNNPAAEVQVTALLTWDDILDVLLDIDVRSRGASGVVEPMPKAAVRIFKSAFLRVLYHAYVKTKVEQPHDQVRRPDNRFWEATRMEPPRTATTSHPDTAASSQYATTPKPQRRLPSPGYLTYVAQEVLELDKLLGDVAAGKVIKAQQDFTALKEMVLVDLVPMLSEYYSVFYQPGCSGSQQDVLVSEELFDALDQLVSSGNLPPQHITPVQTLVASIGDKVESRGNRRKLLEFTVATVRPGPAAAAGAPGGGHDSPQHTSPSGKMDAPSLLRDLMTTAARALKLQLAVASNIDISDGEPLGGALGSFVRLCSMNVDVPLHREDKFGEGAVGFTAKRNPCYADIATRLAEWVRVRKTGCGSADSALLADAGAILAGLVYMQDPLDEAPRDKLSMWTCWARLRRALVPAPLNVPQLEGLRMVQAKWLEAGSLEAAAVLLSREDQALHRSGFVCLNALLARQFGTAQSRFHDFLERAGRLAGHSSRKGESFGPRGQGVMRNIVQHIASGHGHLKQYKRLRKYQLGMPSTVSAAALGEEGIKAASVTQTADFGWGSAGHGRLTLPEAGSIAFQEWAVTGKGGGGGGGGPSGNPTPAHKRALAEEEEGLGAESMLVLALKTLENMCRGGFLPGQLVLSASLPLHAPPPEEPKVQETEMSKEARNKALVTAPAGSVLEVLVDLLRRVVPCLVLAVRYQDCTVLELGRLVLSCMSAGVDGLCSRNQTLLIEMGVPDLLMRVVNLSYRAMEGAGTGAPAPETSSSPAADVPLSVTSVLPRMMGAQANEALALLKVEAGNLLRLLSLGCSALYTERVAPDQLSLAADANGSVVMPLLRILETQVDCGALARRVAVNAALLDLVEDETHDIMDFGLDHHRGRQLLQTELTNSILVLRTLEAEVETLSRASAETWTWEEPGRALQTMEANSPSLRAFAAERVRCVEIAVWPRSEGYGEKRRRIVLWFALSDRLVAWNCAGATARAAEMTWDALHEHGGRGGELTHGVALLRCWDECARQFLAWRALRGAKGLEGASAPGAPPETLPASEARTSTAAKGGRVRASSQAEDARSPSSLAASGRSSSLSQTKTQRRRNKEGGGQRAAGGRSLAEMLRWSEGVPCLLSLIVVVIFLGAYGVPSEAPGAGNNPNSALYQGRFNVTAEMLKWGVASATLGSGSRWSAPPAELQPFDPWRFAPWAQMLLLALASIHVVAMACEIASWVVNDWPAIFLRISAERRLARNKAAGTRSVRANAQDVAVVDGGMMLRLLTASLMPYYLVVLGIFSLLGAVHSPLFLLAHTLRLLHPLAPAARLAAPKLVRTGFIALVVLVCYGLFAYTYFSNNVNAVSRTCHSPWQCVSTVVLAALARDTDVLAHDAEDFAETPALFAASSWEQFRSLYSASFLIVWGLLLQGALLAHIFDAFAQLRQLEEQRQRECEDCDLLSGQARRRPQGVGAAEAAMQGRQLAVGKEGAGSLGPRMFESDPHSPASFVLFLCWASEQVRGSRWVIVDEVLAMFENGDPRFLPLGGR